MQLQSVRDLKTELLTEAQTSHTRALRARRATALLSAPIPPRSTLPIALGIQGQGGDYKLAVRVQETPPGIHQIIERMRQRAHGEIDIRLVGYIHKQPARRKKPWHQIKQRPLLPGISVGHIDVTAGTLGCFVTHRDSPGQAMILSNNHVLANENKARRGERILQPGHADGGRQPRDVVGRLGKFVRLKRRGNAVDAATATLEEGIAYDSATLQGLGKISGLRHDPLEAGEVVYKVGRTTSPTTGRVSAIEVDHLSIDYDMGALAFDGQIEIEPSHDTPFSRSGDSGSLIVDSQYRAVGLLFAGNGVDVTYANPLHTVMQTLGMQLLF